MKRCLIVINGESFRFGGQLSRGRGGEDSYDRQKVATDSHIRFFKNIEDKFYMNVDVLLNSYVLNDEWDKDLTSWYDAYCVKHDFLAAVMPTEQDYISYRINYTKEYIQTSKIDYEFVFFIRIDYYLKRYLSQIFMPYQDKIQFAFYDLNGLTNEASYISPLVSFGLTYVPSKFYPMLFASPSLLDSHHFCRQQLLNDKKLHDTEIECIINTYHFLCTSLGWNPIYTAVGRYESPQMSPIRKELSNGKVIDETIDFKQTIFEETFIEALYNYQVLKD